MKKYACLQNFAKADSGYASFLQQIIFRSGFSAKKIRQANGVNIKFSERGKKNFKKVLYMMSAGTYNERRPMTGHRKR